MSELQALALGVLQGITEFLPVSSSGHLVLARWLFGWDDPGIDFDIAVHLGTLLALLLLFWPQWWRLAHALHPDPIHRPQRRLLGLLILATLPIAIVGLAIRDTLDDDLRDATWVGAFLLVTAAALLAAERLGRRRHDLPALTPRQALLVGVVQSIAVLPGVSRAGFAIVGGMLTDLRRADATQLAFYLAAPAILGAALVAAYDLATDGTTADNAAATIAIGVATSFVTACIAIRALIALVERRSFTPFAAYCALAGLAVLLARAAGA